MKDITPKQMLDELDFLIREYYFVPPNDHEGRVHAAMRKRLALKTDRPKLIRVVEHDHDLEGRGK